MLRDYCTNENISKEYATRIELRDTKQSIEDHVKINELRLEQRFLKDEIKANLK